MLKAVDVVAIVIALLTVVILAAMCIGGAIYMVSEQLNLAWRNPQDRILMIVVTVAVVSCAVR